MTSKEQTSESAVAPLLLAKRPISKLQDLNEIRFAVWEMLDTCYPWSDDTQKYQARPPFDIVPERRNEFIRLQINAHHRNEPLIWHDRLVPEADGASEWVDEKIKQIEHAFLNKDELATIESLCKPFAGGWTWPLRGNPERWQLYALLFNRLMLNPSQTLKIGGQLPISELVQTFSLIGQAVQEPLSQLAALGVGLKENFLYGRLLTPEERKIEQRKEEQKRQDFEIKHYGRILDSTERRQALRQEQIEHAEESAHRAKLRALEAERREADERAKTPLKRLKESNSLEPSEVVTTDDLQPGEQRTLTALSQAYPKGLTIKELAELTKKDALSEETPRGSLDVWLNSLKKRCLIRSDNKRPKQWFFVGKEP